MGATHRPESTPTITTSTNDKLDLFKHHKADYASPKTPVVLNVASCSYLARDGEGGPESAAFQDAIASLYGMAYTLKFMKKDIGRDFVVCKLEALWFDPATNLPPTSGDKSTWSWTMMIRVPDFVTDANLDAARLALHKKKKKPGDFDRVVQRTLDEGHCVQMLHVGPYDEEHRTIAEMASFSASEGLTPSGPHHEIYLSDPRRVPPEKLRTILRQPVA